MSHDYLCHGPVGLVHPALSHFHTSNQLKSLCYLRAQVAKCRYFRLKGGSLDLQTFLLILHKLNKSIKYNIFQTVIQFIKKNTGKIFRNHLLLLNYGVTVINKFVIQFHYQHIGLFSVRQLLKSLK